MICRSRSYGAHGVFILLWTLMVGALWASAGVPNRLKKDNESRKGSPAIRRNPWVREFFRARALAMQPSLRDNDRSLNTTVDFLLDDFVEQSLKLTRKLSAEAAELHALVPRYRTLLAESGGTSSAVPDKSLLEKTRVNAEALRNITKRLESQMDFLIEALRLTVKVHEARPYPPDLKQLAGNIEEVHTMVDTFRKSLDEFFFPKSSTVSLEELQEAALPVQLKKIERSAERIELAAKRLQ